MANIDEIVAMADPEEDNVALIERDKVGNRVETRAVRKNLNSKKVKGTSKDPGDDSQKDRERNGKRYAKVALPKRSDGVDSEDDDSDDEELNDTEDQSRAGRPTVNDLMPTPRPVVQPTVQPVNSEYVIKYNPPSEKEPKKKKAKRWYKEMWFRIVMIVFLVIIVLLFAFTCWKVVNNYRARHDVLSAPLSPSSPPPRVFPDPTPPRAPVAPVTQPIPQPPPPSTTYSAAIDNEPDDEHLMFGGKSHSGIGKRPRDAKGRFVKV